MFYYHHYNIIYVDLLWLLFILQGQNWKMMRRGCLPLWGDPLPHPPLHPMCPLHCHIYLFMHFYGPYLEDIPVLSHIYLRPV